MIWTGADLKTVKDNRDKPDYILSQLTGRSPGSIRGIRRYLGCVKGSQRKWSEDEKKELHSPAIDKVIARTLNRTESEVKSARNRLGIKKRK